MPSGAEGCELSRSPLEKQRGLIIHLEREHAGRQITTVTCVALVLAHRSKPT